LFLAAFSVMPLPWAKRLAMLVRPCEILVIHGVLVRAPGGLVGKQCRTA
jgi:hypothetical protein